MICCLNLNTDCMDILLYKNANADLRSSDNLTAYGYIKEY